MTIPKTPARIDADRTAEPLSGRARAALAALCITEPEQLATVQWTQIAKVRGCGRKTVREVARWGGEYGAHIDARLTELLHGHQGHRKPHQPKIAPAEKAPAAHDLTPPEVASNKIVVTRRMADYHAAIDGTEGRKWGCGKTIDEAVGSLVRNHPEAFGTTIDLGKAGVL